MLDPETRGDMLLRNVDSHTHYIGAQKKATFISTAVRTEKPAEDLKFR
jgi:hypothetical protein